MTDLKNQLRAPVAEAMKAYAGDGALAFHTPGHKQGLGAHQLLQELITPLGLQEEVSLMEELDDLHEPTMCIKEAQELAAALYGADAAYFMINGTSGAIHAMIMGTLQPGDTVLVPRNAHRSMIGGLILAGVSPVFIQPRIDEKLGIPMGLQYEDIVAAADAHPEAKALIMVYPTYYGVTIDLRKVADFIHSRNMLLLVDEAHGPHLRFSDRLPLQALDAGADMAAQSTHKILGSMTQTSILLARTGRIDLERVRSAASLLQSTSPNQLLLASLDIARLQMAEQGEELVGRAAELAEKLRQAVNKIPGLWSFGADYLPAGEKLDLTKVTVSVRSLGITGVQAESILRHTYKIQCELSDAYNLLFIISYADTAKQVDTLIKALQGLAAQFTDAEKLILPVEVPPVPERGISPREAFFAGRETVDFEEAAGYVAAEQIMFYPPGIPILAPGDRIDSEALYYIRTMQRLGLKVVGPADTSLETMQVVRENHR
ncbi:putative Orn/Arg/Lys decarboxylase [Selenomonas ruminantium subsp. lactilytica TAM6421]|uniref:Putative Orn/Arg/Lys decarboxylase n=1 Tax=Selenomonas ruminantium subsp. lactilytica (strain NBRC 103574 / TAM6421) TaxID=927704 RepID=I0GN70_SELRL|nr:aminotransferase class I/II-fold pyridoxal phosphate-dependent enzyme [Selenomonas ruminantium]BAL82207.1 putative Orn/Arg/Lys decarboxylase [Selenomonas ruminantium subsp. lactilytica TAM6421]